MNNRKRSLLPSWKQVVLLLAPIVFLPLALFSKEGRCAYVILIMAVYWMAEVVPTAVTSLIPIFAFPLLGVISTSELCLVYLKETNMMFLGVMTVALAVEYSNLHNRVALNVILVVGQSPRRLLTGFMATTMFLSIWINNTAATAMMVPIVESILQQLYQAQKKSSSLRRPNEELKIASQYQSKDAIAVTLETDDSTNNNCHDNPGFLSQETTVSCTDAAVAATVVPLPEPEPEMFAQPPNEECRRLRDMCYIAVAYASSIGGTGSLTGTSANLVIKGIMDEAFPETNPINFATWMAYNIPGMLILTVLCWVWLQILFVGFGKSSMLASDPETDAAIAKTLKKKYNSLGRLTFHEGVVLSLFCSLVVIWLFRSPGIITGWGDLFKYAFPNVQIGASTPAMLVVFLLFIIPKNPRFLRKYDPNEVVKSEDDQACLTWNVVKKKFPWGVMLLLGGGFAMAEAADKSHLSLLISEQLRSLQSLPKEVVVLFVCLVTSLMTEAAANAAIASIMMPVLKDLSLGIKVNPVYLMLPASLCCSYAFMLPVANANNAIVCGASNMKTITMMKAGLVMKVICVGWALLMINTLGVAMFDLHEFPDWANNTVVV